jgi:putative ABC transport system permease protein
MRAIWAAAFLLRRLRAERGIILVLVALVGTTSFLAAAAPRLYNLVADAGLRQEIAEASTSRRNIELVQELVMPPGEDPTDLVERLGTTYQTLFGDNVEALVGSRETVITSPRFRVLNPPVYTSYVALRAQSGLEGEVVLVDGRWPVATGERLAAAALEFGPPAGEVPDTPPRVEIAISTKTAEESGLALGQVLQAGVDSGDPLLPRALVRPLLATLEIVGVFEVTHPQAPVWYSDTRVQRIGAEWDADSPIVYVTALIAPDAHRDLITSNLAFRYEWHYFIDPDRLDAGQLDAVIPDLRRLETTFSTATFGAADEERIVLRSNLDAVIESYLAQRAASEAVLSVAAIGPLALAAGSIGMLAVLLIARRRATLQLQRGRGAATRLILGAQAWEATVIAGAAAIVGLVLAILLVPGRASDLSLVLAIATAAVTVVLLVGATLPAVRRPLDQGARDEPPPVRAAPRRLVLELTAVGLAAAGIMLLRERGLTIEDGAVPRFDPFMAAVPMLTGFAAGVLAARLYPFPIRALGWLAARRRDLVPVLGLRNIGRRPSFATLPLLVLMLTAAFGSFALVLTSSVDHAQLEASWREIGADYRVDAPPGADVEELDVTTVPGIGPVARAFVNPTASFALGTSRTARIHFAAIDAPAYSALAAAEPAAPAAPIWPVEFTAAAAAGAGSEGSPIPAILSRARPAGAESLTIGSTIRVRFGDRQLSFLIVDVRAAMPGIAGSQTFLVAPLAALLIDPPPGVRPNVLYLRGPASAGGAVTDLVTHNGPAAAAVASRHAWYEDLRGSPLIAVVADGFRIGFIVAVAYAALAVITALTLTAARRTQDLAFLRTLGLSRAQTLGITVIEHATPVLVALVPGLATGIGVAILLESSLGLDAFIGSDAAFRVRIDWAGIAGVAAVLLLVVAAAVFASTWLARRAPVVEALRVGEA